MFGGTVRRESADGSGFTAPPRSIGQDRSPTGADEAKRYLSLSSSPNGSPSTRPRYQSEVRRTEESEGVYAAPIISSSLIAYGL